MIAFIIVFGVAIEVAIILNGNNVAKNIFHTFVLMFLQGNHIRKIISAGLLLILLIIHSVKFFHTHSYNHFGSEESIGLNKVSKKFNTQNISATSDCSICNYQLGKDIDNLFHPVFLLAGPFDGNFNANFYSFTTNAIHPAFEGRGPPVVI